MSLPIGVDLGFSKCCVSSLINGNVEVIENEYASKTTPSYVAFTSTEILVGQPARNYSTIDPLNTVFGFKRLLGLKYEEVTRYVEQLNNIAPVINYKGKPAYNICYRNKSINSTKNCSQACLVSNCVHGFQSIYIDL